MFQFIDLKYSDLAGMIEESLAQTKKVMDQNLGASNKAREILGWPGAMISGSKSGYSMSRPKNVPIFNSNVVIAKGKIWYGDIDLTLSEEKLANLAKELGETVYVLREMDGRFENEGTPRLERAVYAVSPDGKTVFQEYYTRGTQGKFKGKLIQKAD